MAAPMPDLRDDSESGEVVDPLIKWTPLKMLHMEYPEGDQVGHVLAWFSMTPFFIFAGMITLILFRRDLHTISFTLGQLVNEVFNLILKRIIKGETAKDGMVFVGGSIFSIQQEKSKKNLFNASPSTVI